MGCKLKDLFVLIIHCCLSVLVFTKIDEIVFFTQYLYGKTFYSLK